MGCQCRKTLPSKLLILLSLIIMTLFNDTKYSQIAFTIGGMVQFIGILWFIVIFFLNKRAISCQNKND